MGVKWNLSLVNTAQEVSFYCFVLDRELSSLFPFHFHFFISFKSYLKLVFTIVDNKILIHTNYLQERYTLYKRKNH